jgi:hypothetical protein
MTETISAVSITVRARAHARVPNGSPVAVRHHFGMITAVCNGIVGPTEISSCSQVLPIERGSLKQARTSVLMLLPQTDQELGPRVACQGP